MMKIQLFLLCSFNMSFLQFLQDPTHKPNKIILAAIYTSLTFL